QQQVGPSVIVEVEEHGAPSQITRVQAEAGGEGHVVEGAVAVVAIQGGSVIGKIGLENIQPPVAVVIADGRSHSGLFTAVFVIRGASSDRYVGERPVAVVVIKNAGSAVTGEVDVGPAIVVEVESRNAEGVVAAGLIDFRFRRDVFKLSLAQIVIKNIFRTGQAARPAHDWNAFPHARCSLAWGRSRGYIKVHVVCDYQIEKPVAIVIDKGASCSPGFAAAGD